MNTHPSHEEHEHPFSVSLFLFTVFMTLAGYFAAVRFVTPTLWGHQWSAPFWKWFLTFNAFHLAYGLFEGPFHRYVLHSKFLFFGHLNDQHTLHHSHTRVGINGMDIVYNKYAIEEDHQHEASYFPWYSLASFIGISWIVVIPLQFVMPTWPICLGSVIALAFSISLYEIVHMIEHLPFDTFWRPKLQHRIKWIRSFWLRLYTPHLRHHENIWMNENISGFYTIPVWDILMSSYARWKKAYEHDEQVSKEQFKAGIPKRGPILRLLDWWYLPKRIRKNLREEEIKAKARKRFASKSSTA